MGICNGHIIVANKLIDCWHAAAFSIFYAQVHILPAAVAAASYWEWRRRDVRCNLNVVCRASCVGRFAGGLFGCLVYVNCTDTRVSIPSFGGFSLLLSVLAGAHKSVISAGGNSELNSFHLGQDCPQSSELNSFHLG